MSNTSKKPYDLIIVGAGPAGFSAAIYAARKKLKIAILTDKVGGQALLTQHIQNYAGFTSISGLELVSSMRKQVESYGVEIIEGAKLQQIKQAADLFELLTSKGPHLAKTVLIASGVSAKRLNVPGEKEFEGKGVSFCSICDAPLFSRKDVVVVGGGNAGLEAASDLTKYASKIYVLEFLDKLTGDELTQEKLKQSNKVTFILNTAVKEIKGEKFVEGIVYKNNKTGRAEELKVSGVFVSIGWVPSTDFVKGLLKINDKKEIIVDPNTNMTSVPGIFAAGDVTDVPFKQIIISAGEGAKAALAIYNYLQL